MIPYAWCISRLEKNESHHISLILNQTKADFNGYEYFSCQKLIFHQNFDFFVPIFSGPSIDVVSPVFFSGGAEGFSSIHTLYSAVLNKFIYKGNQATIYQSINQLLCDKNN